MTSWSEAEPKILRKAQGYLPDRGVGYWCIAICDLGRAYGAARTSTAEPEKSASEKLIAYVYNTYFDRFSGNRPRS